MLWDWDSWLSDVALRQILLEYGTDKDRQEALQYEQGCVLNALHYGGMGGWIPDRYCISIGSTFKKLSLPDREGAFNSPWGGRGSGFFSLHNLPCRAVAHADDVHAAFHAVASLSIKAIDSLHISHRADGIALNAARFNRQDSSETAPR